MRAASLIAFPTLVALAGAALIVLQQALPEAGTALEYRRPLLAAEPWRIVGAHLVHINWTHALVNALAWVVLARLFERELPAGAQLLCLGGAAVVISLALALLLPGIAWYRGASGVLHALYFAGATAMLAEAARGRGSPRWPQLLLAAGWIKVALEIPRGGETVFAAWLGAPVVPQAHLFGALFGTAFGLLSVLRRRGG